MNNSWPTAILGSRVFFAVLSGVCLALAFPNTSIAGFAWVAPGMMLGSALGTRGWQAFRLGYIAGLAHYLVSLHWLLYIPYRWHGIPLGPAAGWLSLSAFLSLIPGFWIWLSTRLAARSNHDRVDVQGPEWQAGSENFLNGAKHVPGTWAGRLCWALICAAIWVALEMYITRIFGGFPWNLLGASQYQMVPLLQISSYTSVYGVSFLVVWFSVSLLCGMAALIRQPAARGSSLADILLPSLAVALAFSLGLRAIRVAPTPNRTLTVTLIQPSIPQTVIWDPAADDQRFRELVALSQRALSNHTDLLIWPESAIPKLLRYNKEVYEAVTGLARSNRVWMIVCADDAEKAANSSSPKDAKYFNSSFLVSPEGRLEQDYRKQSLVIFGEYIPLYRWLPFLSWFTPIESGFTAGTEPVPFRMPGLDATASVLICFEDVFPQLGRSATSKGADFLVNVTNDGWFGESSAQWQQAACGLFRAVENRRPLVRCTNTGLTCWIDPYGRVQNVFRDSRGSIYGQGFLTFELQFRDKATRPGETFYTRCGDVFGWCCVAISVAALAVCVVGERRRAST